MFFCWVEQKDGKYTILERGNYEKLRKLSKKKNYNMPESLNAFCNKVSLTAAKTNRIFDVSVACVR